MNPLSLPTMNPFKLMKFSGITTFSFICMIVLTSVGTYIPAYDSPLKLKLKSNYLPISFNKSQQSNTLANNYSHIRNIKVVLLVFRVCSEKADKNAIIVKCCLIVINSVVNHRICGIGETHSSRWFHCYAMDIVLKQFQCLCRIHLQKITFAMLVQAYGFWMRLGISWLSAEVVLKCRGPNSLK